MRIAWHGRVAYEPAWELQRQIHAGVVAGAEDQTILLEHDPVYTAGKRTEDSERPVDGTPVIDVDRGGNITWHGPGQVTGYPIVRLPQRLDVVAHVRRTEQLLIDTCADFGLETARVKGRSGVWTADGRRKVAAIGIRVAQGVTMHGFALNCDPDLSGFGQIIPCGITDASVTSLSVELGRDITVHDAVPVLERHLPSLSQAVPTYR